MDETADSDESRKFSGGLIPGTAGIPAFSLVGPEPSPVPILIAVPHAGRAYSGDVLQSMRDPGAAALKLEDRYVDRLAKVVAQSTGARLLIANAPRAMIDLNRAPDDIDWEMFEKSERPDSASKLASRRTRSGLGLIPRRVPGIGELWKRRQRADELTARIADVHAPYHACLGGALSALRDRWGASLLLDFHSMPPVTVPVGLQAPEFVLGDRFGSTCHGGLVAAAFSYFDEKRRIAAHNRPYAGGYVLERHADPESGVHTMQVEIDRRSYLDSQLADPGAGFDATVAILIGLVRELAAQVGELGGGAIDRDWQEAAE